MINRIHSSAHLIIAFLCGMCAAGILAVPSASAQTATTTPQTPQPPATLTLEVEKKFSGPDEGFTVGEFSFEISGNGVNEMVAHGDSIELEAGTYTITEIGPAGFDHDLWRIQWSGACSNDNNDDTNATIVIDDGDADGRTVNCRADNQYRPEDAESDDRTIELIVEKKFSGPAEGYVAGDFSFTIVGTNSVTGSSTNATVPHGGTIALGIGTYTITEIGPSDFDHDDWRIQWSGDVCSNDNDDDTDATITIEASDLNKNQVYCRADNQFRPDDSEDGGGTTTPEMATLIVEKVVVGTSTTPDMFSFSITGTTTLDVAFEPDGSNQFAFATGTYSVVETGTTTGYTVTYDNCTDVVLAAGDTETCIITNTFDDDDGGGNGGDDDDDDGGGGNNDDDDDDDGNGGNDGSSSSGGSSRSGSGGSDDDGPDGLVAGISTDQTQVIPSGAANTGAGGTAGSIMPLMLVVLLAFATGLMGVAMIRFAR